MAKFKHTEKAILKATNKEVLINKVIEDYGSNSTKYELKTGETVNENELTHLRPELLKEINKKYQKETKKEKSVSVVEKSDKKPDNKQVEKSEKIQKSE